MRYCTVISWDLSQGINRFYDHHSRQRRHQAACGCQMHHQIASFFCCSELEKEAEANAVLYRNTFGTQPKKPLGPMQNAFDLTLKNPANTNVVLWGNRLLALWEVKQTHCHAKMQCILAVSKSLSPPCILEAAQTTALCCFA